MPDRRALLAEPVPLAQSEVWQLQRDYFKTVGPDAWRRQIVPSFITANSFIARAYAQLAAAYRADTSKDGPLHIIELGAGSGRFAHFFLKHLHATAAADAPIRYVMTDISRANIDFWRNHPQLAAFVENGLLDFAEFDAVNDRRLQLEVSGRTLSAASIDGPVMAIANYVFDSIEQDAFQILNGRLNACLVSLDDTGQGEIADRLNGLSLNFRVQAADREPYPDPRWNDILACYRRELPDGTFLFPVGACRTIENLRQLANDRLFVVAGDKGLTQLDEFRGVRRFNIVKHGSISLAVNFHALAMLTAGLGGTVMQSPHAGGSLNVLGFLFGRPPDEFARTREIYGQVIEHMGPDDLYNIKKSIQTHYASLSAQQLIAYLRVMQWDPSIVAAMHEPLANALMTGLSIERRSIYEGLLIAWDRYFPLGEADDFAFCLANLMAAMGRYRDALRFLEISRATHGDRKAIQIGIALCLQHIDARRAER